ncbi:MAG: hypothetical protein R2697_15505 [Ilumatobacteraceae bacterium]
MSPLRRAEILVVVGLIATGCANSDRTDHAGEPELVGASQITSDSFDEEEDGPPPAIAVLDDDHVRFTYHSGTCGAATDAPNLPRSVTVDYFDDRIRLTVDATVTCDGDSDGIGIARAAQLVLDQPVRGRELQITDAQGSKN